MANKSCDGCVNFRTGNKFGRLSVPSWCDHHREPVNYDFAACVNFQDKDEFFSEYMKNSIDYTLPD